MNTLSPNFRNVIVIGASAGGVEALVEVVRNLPPDLPAAVFVVQHLPARAKSNLPSILQSYTGMVVREATDGDPVQAGTIYLARPDRHLLVEGDRVGVAPGPPENRFRPAVDVLFRSAAYTYRERVIGVVLTGALSDGTSGMWMVKRCGGLAIVQDPEEASFPDMPLGVMQYTEVDHVSPLGQLGGLLGTLVRQPLVEARDI
ncbi:chemotaxis response regulator CheB [Lewinella marina]|uniref:protein-glutamate methylesterase n=1 Tax=Neolewinella marina TaxID=438751 RepID=A0A2G0CJE3_9BACT|nr:chemotaxis protein CheB [Neolewinella marina]NJB84744.1 chemotaxis response regulator CheB [Neolewinella marina]PHL00097.1 hypothetical protein CGL56_03385 [Neolewinella marina]